MPDLQDDAAIDAPNEAPASTGNDEKPAARDALPHVDPYRLRWRLLADAALRRALVVMTFLVLLIATFTTLGGGAMSLAVMLIAGVWVFMGIEGAKVARQLPELSAILDLQPAQGEARLAALLKRRLLPRWVKLMLWHRLAVVRHREGRYAESASLAQVLLDTPQRGTFRQSQTHLMLMQLEARLELRDAWSAWHTLSQLCQQPLSLTEALQRMALRTRYEMLVGLDGAALVMADQKLQLSELMPGPQCGAFHAMLATAAERHGHADWSRHVWGKAALLCTDEQLTRLRTQPV